MLTKTQAIVLKSIPYSESGLIAYVFTRNEGKLTIFIHGARSTKSKKGFIWKPGYLLNLDLDIKPNAGMQKVKEATLTQPLSTIPFEIMKNAICTISIELLSKSLAEEQINPTLFDFSIEYISQLDNTSQNPTVFLVYFVIKLTEMLGFLPAIEEHGTYFDLINGNIHQINSFHSESICDNAFTRVAEISKTNIFDIQSLSLNTKERQILINAFIKYLTIQLPGFQPPKSLEVYREMLR